MELPALLKNVPLVEQIMSAEESKEYDRTLSCNLPNLQLKASYYNRDSLDNYTFDINK